MSSEHASLAPQASLSPEQCAAITALISTVMLAWPSSSALLCLRCGPETFARGILCLNALCVNVHANQS